jgi:hypothetical protein
VRPDPIFFAITRSFWLAVVTVMLILQQGEPMIRAVAQLAVTIWGAGDVEAVVAWVDTVAPVATLLLLVRERAGAARPYTVRPSRSALK